MGQRILGTTLSWSLLVGNGADGLGFLDPNDTTQRSAAVGVSGDGTIVVGWSTSMDYPVEAFRRTSATGMTGLGVFSGATGSTATAISSDGTTVVGDGDAGSRLPGRFSLDREPP